MTLAHRCLEPWPGDGLQILKKMDWIPVVFVTFKALVFGAGMFFAIKWHYERGRKGKEKQSTALRAGSKVAAVFVLSLLGISLLAFGLGKVLGLDLALP